MRWEYKSIILTLGMFGDGGAQSTKIETQLNSLGAQGWELVNYLLVGTKYRAIFKRPK